MALCTGSISSPVEEDEEPHADSKPGKSSRFDHFFVVVEGDEDGYQYAREDSNADVGVSKQKFHFLRQNVSSRYQRPTPAKRPSRRDSYRLGLFVRIASESPRARFPLPQ